MHTQILYSDKLKFSQQNNPFIRFLLMNPIRVTLVNDELYLVARDTIEALGYSLASIQHLTEKCDHKKRCKINGPRGITSVNIIPIEDFFRIVLECPFNNVSVLHMRRWIIEQAVNKAKSFQVLPDNFEQCSPKAPLDKTSDQT